MTNDISFNTFKTAFLPVIVRLSRNEQDRHDLAHGVIETVAEHLSPEQRDEFCEEMERILAAGGGPHTKLDGST